MVEQAPQTKNQEERPLLKVEGGGGDGRVPPVDTAWSVHCSKRYFDRWPEFLTACWMTGILLAISFLVMYVLTIGNVKGQPVVILKCNTSKPNSEVYYHQIVQRQSTLLFSLYEEYLSKMATKYPALHFNVIFMIDDTLPTNRRAFPHVNVYGKLIPFHSKKETISNFQNRNAMIINKFQHKYQNVNVTITSLSEFMGRTQLKYKWRTIPLSHLSFYARISSVWQTGGIGIDLPLYSSECSHQLVYPDKRLEMILKQHNDGINVEEYRQILDNIGVNEENELISVIYGIVNQMMKDTTDFFNSPWIPFVSRKELNTSNLLEQTHRGKREVTKNGNIIDTSTKVNTEAIKLSTVPTTGPKTDKKIAINKTSDKTNVNNTENNLIKFLFGMEKIENSTKKNVERANTTTTSYVRMDEFDYVVPNMFMSYQLSILSDDFSPMYLGYPKAENEKLKVKKSGDHENFNLMENKHRKPGIPYFLTLSSEGTFLASTSAMHPLLGHLLSLGCRRMSPRTAIQEAYLAQCSGSPKGDVYCDNIYLLNLA